MTPEVSVVLPVFNGETYLAQAIESILGQSLSDIELIIIDDGSSDGSLEIAERYANSDSRVVLLTQPNCGLVRALNVGLQAARSNLVARMDADDISVPDRLRLQLNFMRSNSEVAVVGGGVRIIDSAGLHRGVRDYPNHRWDLRRQLSRGSPLAHPATMMRKNVVEQVGGYRERFRSAEDYDLWARVVAAGHLLANLPCILLAYRLHDSSVSSRSAYQQSISTLAVSLLIGGEATSKILDAVAATPITESELRQLTAINDSEFRARLFVATNAQVSGGDAYAVGEAHSNYIKLPTAVRGQKVMVNFQLRLATGLMRHRRIFDAAAIVFSAGAPIASLMVEELAVRSMRRITRLFYRQ